MAKFKKIKVKTKEGFQNYEVGADASNVDLSDGTTVENKLQELKKAEVADPEVQNSGSIGMVQPDGKTILMDENGIISGSSLDFVGTEEELDQKMQEENMEGTTVFLKGVNMVVPGTTIDSALSETSENPVQNKVINQEFENVKAMRGSDTEYGMVKLTNATDITDSTGLAVPASELNAAVEGTLANEINLLKNKFYQYKKYDLTGMLKETNWFTATYLNPGQTDGYISLNLSEVLPAPFNDKTKCIIISAGCFDGAAWFHGAPRTTFSDHEVEIYVENIQYVENLLLTITLMRTDI